MKEHYGVIWKCYESVKVESSFSSRTLCGLQNSPKVLYSRSSNSKLFHTIVRTFTFPIACIFANMFSFLIGIMSFPLLNAILTVTFNHHHAVRMARSKRALHTKILPLNNTDAVPAPPTSTTIASASVSTASAFHAKVVQIGLNVKTSEICFTVIKVPGSFHNHSPLSCDILPCCLFGRANGL
jgi:hypothetical protein